MEKKYLITSLIVGTLIILAPTIITGHLYDISSVMGGLLISEFIMRTIAFIIGLLVIYDGVKTYFK